METMEVILSSLQYQRLAVEAVLYTWVTEETVALVVVVVDKVVQVELEFQIKVKQVELVETPLVALVLVEVVRLVLELTLLLQMVEMVELGY